MNWKRLVLAFALSVILVLGSTAAAVKSPPAAPATSVLVTGLTELQGSAIGPDGALYVTAPLAGSIYRVDPGTGDVTLFATGLPPRDPDFFFIGSGAVDITFLNGIAYALVTGVADDLLPGSQNLVGIYRMDDPDSWTVIADIGAWSEEHPPATDIFVPTGFQYAIEIYQGGFLVTDGHHNRVLWVSPDGDITEVIAFPDIVPTGLEVSGDTVYMAEAGPIPHLPKDGRIVSFTPGSPTATQVAFNARLLVDVEFGPGGGLYALSQGIWKGPFEGTPARPNTGSLVRANPGGTFTVIQHGLDRPTSMEFIGDTAYVVTLGGEVWKIENVPPPPYGN